MKRKLIRFFIFPMAFFYGTLPPSLFAAHFHDNPPVITMDCNGYTIVTRGIIVADRDNTGSNQESVGIVATDNTGKIILSARVLFPTNQAIILNQIASNWKIKPQPGTLTFNFVSPAGGGLSEQIVFTTTGLCGATPSRTMTEWGGGIISILLGVISFYLIRKKKQFGSKYRP